MKTKADISIPILIILFGAIFLTPLMHLSFTDTGGKLLIVFGLLIITLGLWKIERFKIEDNILIKYNFIFLCKRKRDLTKTRKFKTKLTDLSLMPRYNLAGLLKLFKNGERYSKFRILTLYFNGQFKMTIDERVMSKDDFEKIIACVKKHYTKQKGKGKN